MISFDDITNNILTLAEQQAVLSEVDQLLEANFETESDKSVQTVLGEKVRVGTKEMIEDLLTAEKVGHDWQKLKNLLESLKERLLSLPVARVTLAFEPNIAFIEEIAQSLRGKTNEPLIIDLAVDRQILGGINLAWKGRVYDLTVKTKLDEWENKNNRT